MGPKSLRESTPDHAPSTDPDLAELDRRRGHDEEDPRRYPDGPHHQPLVPRRASAIGKTGQEVDPSRERRAERTRCKVQARGPPPHLSDRRGCVHARRGARFKGTTVYAARDTGRRRGLAAGAMPPSPSP